MIRLDTVNRSLTLFLGGAQVTAPLQIIVSYSDQTSTTYLGSTQLANSNGTTVVTICSAPAASVIRDIDMVTVLNTDSASQTVTIQLLDTATNYKIISVTLLVGDKLTYTHGSAWQVVNSAGDLKNILSSSGVDSFSGGSTGLTPATATTGAITLGGTLAVGNGGTGTASPALVAGTNVTITGTWPNQTINSSNTGGTVTSVTGTAPVVSSGGTTPAISMAAANTTTSGYLTSTDWNTFNGKGSGSVTSVAATVPAFLSVSGSPITGSGTLAISYSGTALPIANGGTALTTAPTAGQLLIGNGTGYSLSTVTAGSGITVTNGSGSITIATTNTGLVSSVTGTSPVVSSGGTTPAISLAASYGDTQNPYASKTANYVLAAPNGSAGVPTFRAIVAADIPTLNQNTTGTASNVTGTVAIANGGTGQTTASTAFNALSPITSVGDLIIGSGVNNATRLGIGATGYVLTSNGTTASWAAGGGGSSITISNDVATASNLYPAFFSATSGTASTVYTSNANLLYKPSTGELTAVAVISSNGIQVNSSTVSANYTIAAGNNGLSAGPISVATGITVTVSTGSTWSVV